MSKRKEQVSERILGSERGFSMLELSVVSAIMLVVLAIALFNLPSMLQSTRSDTALREVMEQIRQAREYAIANRRYVQIAFNTVGSRAQVQITQRNDLTAGGAATNPVLSTVPIQYPMQFLLLVANPDTPDGFGHSAALSFNPGGTVPAGGLLFQSDGELVNGGSVVAGSSGSGTPINGSIFLGVTGQVATARAVTVMGTTGRVHGWKWNGTSWVQF